MLRMRSAEVAFYEHKHRYQFGESVQLALRQLPTDFYTVNVDPL